jgi:WD40 repeat protein
MLNERIDPNSIVGSGRVTPYLFAALSTSFIGAGLVRFAYTPLLPVGTGSHAGHKPVTELSVSPRGSFIASSDATEVLLRQLDPFRPAGNRVQPKGSRISAIALSDGELLTTGLGNGTIVLWEAATGEQLGPPLEGHDVSYVGSVTFSPDGRFLASGSGDKTVILWSLGQE